MASIEQIRYRLTGQAMVDRTRASGIRTALNPQEAIAIAGLFVVGVALLFPEGDLSNKLIGGNTLWGALAIGLAIPQAIGLTLARLGFSEVPMAHNVRIMLLLISMATFIVSAAAFALAGALWLGGGLCLLLAITAGFSSRYVHLNNGRSRRPSIDSDVTASLRRQGLLPSERMLKH